MLKNKKGFTLIELLIVIAIIGILMAVVLVVLNPAQMRNRASDSNRRQTLAKVGSVMQACMTANNNNAALCNTQALVTAFGLDANALANSGGTWVFAGNAGNTAACVSVTMATSATTWFKYDTAAGRMGICTSVCAAGTAGTFADCTF